MTPENFCYWLQGFVEIGEPVTLSKQQLQVLKDHLKLVFDKKTPDYAPTSIGGIAYPVPSNLGDSKPFVPFEPSQPYANAIVFEAISPEERKNLILGHPIPTKFDLSLDSLPVLGNVAPYFSFSSDVPISC
jgi:hypothetical protein